MSQFEPCIQSKAEHFFKLIGKLSNENPKEMPQIMDELIQLTRD